MDAVGAIVFLTLLFIYEFIVEPQICKRKINRHITNLGGEISTIERLTRKEFLYCVYYTLNGNSEKAIVRFNIFYESTWK
jgi:hypothetical protein